MKKNTMRAEGWLQLEGERARNLRITGSGSSPGGIYEKVTIMGEGTINDDIDCFACKTQGTSRFGGDVKCESFHVSGNSDIAGKIMAEMMKVFGEVKISGNVKVKEARIRGSVETKAGVSAETIDLRGNLSVNEDCEVETFLCKGGFRVGGLLNAGDLEVKMKFPSKAKEIGGEKIRIERDKFPFSMNKKGQLEAETIEGDDVKVAYTSAKIVRGNRVKIGPGCQIGLVEYKDQLDVNPDSSVNDQIKR